MIKYWPNEQGIELNHAIVNLFSLTKKKLFKNLSNITNHQLYIDILDNNSKYKFFNIILQELELLILDIIELNLTIKELKNINYKLLYNFIETIINKFTRHLEEKNSFNHIYIMSHSYQKIIFLDHKLLLENLLIYLIFGSSYINNELFVFENEYTPQAHVNILLENFIIQISNITCFYLFDNMKSLAKLTSFLNKNKLCNNNYISIRSIALFKNKLIWNNLIYLYINQPKIIYNSRYQVWLLSSNGLITKYIYASRTEDLKKLSKHRLIFLILIEVQDLIIPKIEKIILILSKIILYIIINIIGNSTIFIVRTITYQLNRKPIKP